MEKKGTNNGQFQPGDPRAGRPKGSANKMTRAAKEAFALAFEELGGVGGLTEWGRRNRTEFYKLFARLIPAEQMTAASPEPPTIQVNFVQPGDKSPR
jgi:hypothetical protein